MWHAIKQETFPLEDIISTIMKRKLKWYEHVTSANNRPADILQATLRPRPVVELITMIMMIMITMKHSSKTYSAYMCPQKVIQINIHIWW